MNGPAEISVVIPTYGRRAALQRALDALAQQTMTCDRYEVVVTIDGSADGTTEMLAAFQPPYRLTWRWQPNRGRAAACNLGIGIAAGDLIVLLDDDMEAAPEFLDAHAAEHRRQAGRVVVGAVPVVTNHSSTAAARYIAAKFGRHLERLATPGHRFNLRDFYSGNCSLSRSIFQQVGGFDEAFTIYGNEDLELSWRLAGAGVQIAYSADAIAYQHYTKNFAALARDNVAKGRTAVRLAHKFPEATAHLKLASHASSGRRRRMIVGALLALTRMWPPTSELVINAVDSLSRVPQPILNRLYSLVLDYLYFVGAAAAQRESRAGHQRLARAK